MDIKAKAARAQSVINDEIFVLAVDETLAGINRALLAAKTPEEREQHWQEYHGLKRAVNLLRRWPVEGSNTKQ